MEEVAGWKRGVWYSRGLGERGITGAGRALGNQGGDTEKKTKRTKINK